MPGADEWLGLRPFRDGDSPRQVDWKAYARDAPLLVKEYSAAGAEMRIFDLTQPVVWGWRRNWSSWRDGLWMRRPRGAVWVEAAWPVYQTGPWAGAPAPVPGGTGAGRARRGAGAWLTLEARALSARWRRSVGPGASVRWWTARGAGSNGPASPSSPACCSTSIAFPSGPPSLP